MSRSAGPPSAPVSPQYKRGCASRMATPLISSATNTAALIQCVTRTKAGWRLSTMRGSYYARTFTATRRAARGAGYSDFLLTVSHLWRWGLWPRSTAAAAEDAAEHATQNLAADAGAHRARRALGRGLHEAVVVAAAWPRASEQHVLEFLRQDGRRLRRRSGAARRGGRDRR